jgi:hypothetical protein
MIAFKDFRIDPKQKDALEKMYPVGSKIMVDEMDDPHPIPSGSIGTVEHIDSAGQIHLKEYGLALILGTDKFHKIE